MTSHFRIFHFPIILSQPFQDEKNRQALDDFKKFCNFILDYEANEEVSVQLLFQTFTFDQLVASSAT